MVAAGGNDPPSRTLQDRANPSQLDSHKTKEPRGLSSAGLLLISVQKISMSPA